MRRGATLLEITLVLAVVGLIVALGAPAVAGWLDRAAVEAAARETTMALALARHHAIAWGRRTRLRIHPERLTVDTLGDPGWGAWLERPGAASSGVRLAVTNPVVRFAPNGIAWGFSNTRVVLHRGLQSATITVSRVGRVKRW